MEEIVTEFSFELSPPQLVYYPGQHITGTVILVLSKEMDMESLRLKFCGKGYCHWVEHESVGDRQGNVAHTSEREIIREVRYLFGSAQGGKENLVHPAGRHSYNFSFKVPQNIPSTFEEKGGRIRYILKAMIDNASNVVLKHPIIINDIIDTNLPIYVEAVGGEYRNKGGCSFIKAGVIEITASIDRGCYCPGETMLLNVDVQNQSMIDLKSLKAQLLQIVTCTHRNKSKTVTKEVSRLDLPVAPKGALKKWENQPLAVPAITPSILNSSVVSVHYELRVVDGARTGKDAYVKMDVIIGTIPYKLTYGISNVADQEADIPAVGKSLSPFHLSELGYKEMPAALYSSVSGAGDVSIANRKDNLTHGKLLYTPVYTFAKPYQDVLAGCGDA